MKKFITFVENDEEGDLEYFILQREFPHVVAKISEIPKQVLVPAIPVSGYNLYLVFNYTLRGKFIPSYKEIDKEVEVILQSMGSWFLENRILVNLKKYKKWKI